MHEHRPARDDRYVPARTNDGWRAAAATIALAVVLIAMATVIHVRTYKSPTDPTWRAAGQGSASKTAPAH
jgi:hypothetical protein